MALTDPAFQRSVLDRLLQLNYHAYLHVTALLLERMGYQDVQLLSRTGYVGRNRMGGADMLAYRPVPGGRRLTVIQAKQFSAEHAVFKRTLDELRGVCLRSGAAEGMLVTTSSFSETVTPAGFASAPIAPVRLIDGEALAEHLSLYRVGVTWSPAASPRTAGEFRVDEPFFKEMEDAYPGVARPVPGTRQIVSIEVEVTARKRRA